MTLVNNNTGVAPAYPTSAALPQMLPTTQQQWQDFLNAMQARFPQLPLIPIIDSSTTPNEITLASNSALNSSYAFGVEVTFLAATTNTSSTVNININGLGDVQVILPGGSLPAVGAIAANYIYKAIYDGAFFEIQLTPSGAPAPLTWVSITSPTADPINGITTDGTHVYIVDDTGAVWDSLDGGLTWSALTNSGVGAGNNGNINYQNGALIAAGSGNPLARSLDNGVTWTLINTGIVVAGALELGSDPGGRWTGFGNVSGNASNHGYSVDNGLTWIVPGSGGISGDIGSSAQSPQVHPLNVGGVEFINVLGGQPVTSVDGANWVSPTAIGNASSIFPVGGQIICGIDAAVLVASTVAGLSGAARVNLPMPSGDLVICLCGDATVSVYVAISDVCEVTNASNPNGPWVASTLNFQVGEVPVQVLFDTAHNNFIAVGNLGSISVANVP